MIQCRRLLTVALAKPAERMLLHVADHIERLQLRETPGLLQYLGRRRLRGRLLRPRHLGNCNSMRALHDKSDDHTLFKPIR